ncbi:MAG: DUF1592 domain-containing protein [Planctomycetales bacterium]|nr:DUF1592 domain-containing protein [Planctomycetales bacterium]
MPNYFGKTRLLFVLMFLASCPFAADQMGRADDAESPTSAATDANAIDAAGRPTLTELKRSGRQRSRFHPVDAVDRNASDSLPESSPQANLTEFNSSILPLLGQHCVDCHGADVTEGNVRIDTLDPDLLRGADTDWWVEVFAVVTKGEMPPPDDSNLSTADRQQIVDWLSNELHAASELRRESGSPSSFRRLTRYEYNYALQDLLGLPWDFAKDLPPEPHSTEGFENSADLLHLSTSQFETYHRLARQALARSTVIGDRPHTLNWGISMSQAAEREWQEQDAEIAKAKQDLANDTQKLEGKLAKLEAEFHQPHQRTYYKQLSTGRTAQARWQYYEAKYAFAPTDKMPPMPNPIECVAVLPARGNRDLVIELGNQLPDEGIMRVTARVSRVETETADQPGFPSVRLLFGWQASNEGRALLPVSQADIPITASPSDPQLVTWEIPLGEIYPRNTVRKTSTMGAMPSPSEYIRIENCSASNHDVQLDFVTVEAPYFAAWPPVSHRQIFFASEHVENELAYAKEILQKFMFRAWRRPVTSQEVDRKMELFAAVRPECDSFEEAVIEVLATVLSSPQFLFVANHPLEITGDAAYDSDSNESLRQQRDFQLANRLALFLWCSVPDSELLDLAASGELSEPSVLSGQVDRLLADARSGRFAEQFVHQWLNLELLEFVNFKRQMGHFDPLLKAAMLEEPVALFAEILQQDASVLDFIHADYAMVNERLAKHYGLEGVHGNEFRRVQLADTFQRGGLLTQAGTLAMNSDWPDSHPLKRAVWLLERILNDPPPPPPPAVPQIDLADPEIAKMTLKERIENHRNQAACNSCHAKIDPWGIAFENYDALGRWREQVNGKSIDATSELFNQQELDGMDGLKRYLLESRQDQFVEAMVHKLATFALGRSLRFEDRSAIEAITSDVRQQGDGLKTMIQSIVHSELFRSY